MRLLVEAVPALAVLALVWLVVAAMRRRRPERWRSRTRALPGNRIAIEVARPGEPTQVVAQLDPSQREFDAALVAAQQQADELAASLNASR